MGILVQFTDQSTPGPSGPITGWAWDFGDTGTSTDQNPQHTYAANGTYSVSLEVTGTAPDGTSSTSHSIAISDVVSEPPQAGAGKTWFGSSASGTIPYADVESSILNGTRELDIIHTYKRLDSYDSASFPGNGDDSTSLQTQFDAGKILFYNFAFKIGGVVPDGTSTWNNLAAGNYDSHLTTLADKIAAWSAAHGDAQVFISWEAEMDRRIGTSGSSAGQFPAAWQHIHDLFVAEGARDACIFVWSPTGYQSHAKDWTTMYPGDAYVDWLGYDPYGKVDPNTGAPDATAHGSYGEDEADTGIDDTGIYRFYKWANGAGAKDLGTGLTYTKIGSHTMPIMVCETGLSYNPGASSAFLSQYRTWWSDLTSLMGSGRYPLMKGYVFFPNIDSYDPRLDVGSGNVASPQAGSMLANFRSLAALPRLNQAGSTPSAGFPSTLTTSGGNLVDANGTVMPRLKGFNIQAAGWSQQTYTDIYAKGGRILRAMVFWDQLEPSRGAINPTFVTNLDTLISRAHTAGLYVILCFYYGPNGVHKPNWVPDSKLSSYATYGQYATQYLAKRYGDPTDPLGAGKYTKTVAGFGINEPTPDSSSNGYLATHMSEQKTMMQWFRAYASHWIGVISCGYGGGCPLPNVTGSGQSTQTFTGATNDPFSGMGNWMMDLHNYFMATTTTSSTPVFDGRNVYGMPNHNVQIGAGDSSYPAAGTTRSQCQQAMAAFLASHKSYCGGGHANVPLMIGEWGWTPAQFNGGDLYAADLAAAMDTAGAAVELQWDYNVNQTQDRWAARPGGTWQTATTAWMAAA